MQNVGAPWLMTELTRSPLLVALVQTATALPTFLVALPAGVLADIVDRRRLLIAIQIWVVVVAAALAALTAAGLVGPAVLLGFTFLIGMGLASFLPTWQSSVPELVPPALHGSSPDVGITGHSLGGGMGWLVSKYGLQTNSVTAMELVTADGHAAGVDAENEPELFWALRGGNGNFGLVTAIEFAVYPGREPGKGAL